MRLNFPQSNKAFIQNNRSNVFPLSNIWSSLNLDLQSNVGVLRVSPRIKLNTGSLNNAPVAIQRFGQRIYTLAGTTIYRNTNSSGLPNDAFVADTSGSASTDYSSNTSDMLGCWNVLFATAPTRLRSLSNADGGTWSDRATITSGINHKLCYFKKFDRLYYTDQTIKSMTEAYVEATSGDYTLPGFNTVGLVDMKATSQYIWIACKTEATLQQKGEIWQWDGISAQITNKFNLPGALAIVAIVIDPIRDIPMAVSDKGVLYEFNGSSFSEVDNGRLPYTFGNLPYMGASPFSTQDNDRFIHPNGIYFTRWNTVRCLINGVNGNSTATQNENLPSGVWEWSRENGFVHVSAPSYDPISTSVTDWSQGRISRAGALVDMNIPTTSAKDGTFMLGATYYTNVSSTASAIFYDNSNNTIQKKGYVVTSWIESNDLADSWDVLWTSYRKFLESTDSFTVKYRNTEESSVSASITWVNTTSFTVLNSAIDISLYWTTGTGAEVEIINGTGGGLCAHITNAVNNAGTWTVTIDETATGVTTGTAWARFQKWTKVYSPVTNASPYSWAQFALGTTSTPRIQYKICFTWTGNGEFYKSTLTSNEDISTKQ